MMRRVLLMFYNRKSGINEAAFLLGFFTLLSQLLGLVRDRIFASTIGPGPILDAYYASFKIPDFLYISLASLASVTVILPLLSQKFGQGTDGERSTARDFFSQIFTVFALALAGVSVLLFILMPQVVHLIVPGFPESQMQMVIWMSRIMLISPIIFGISTMIGSVTQMFRKFLIFALAPIMYNLGIIIGALCLYPVLGPIGLAIGVITGAVLHLSIQLPVLFTESFVPRFVRKINWNEIRGIIKISLPRTVGLSMSSFTAIILVAIISGFSPGTMSIFSFAYNLQSVPIGVIGISYSVASFPVLITLFNSGEISKFTTTILETIRKIIFWSLPIMALFIILRAQIVRVLLGGGSFSWDDTRLTAAILAMFVLGIVAQSIVHVLVRAYYAAGNTWKPLIMNFIGEIITIIAAYGLLAVYAHADGFRSFIETVLRVEGVPETRLTMVALAFTIGNILNLVLLVIVFSRNFRGSFETSSLKKLWITLGQAALASGVVALAGYATLQIMGPLVNQDRFLGILGQGMTAGVVAIICGVMVLRMVKNQELTDATAMISRRVWKTPVVQEENIESMQ